jgi:hypothetical protein
MHTHTHNSDKKYISNSSPLWVWIILVSPLPFSKLCMANLLVPPCLTYDTFCISQSHTIPTYFYPKNNERMFFQNTDVQVQGCLISQTRTLSSELFYAPYLQQPILGIFEALFQITLCININPPFSNQLNVQQGPLTLHSQALWSSDTTSWLHIRSWNYTLCPII